MKVYTIKECADICKVSPKIISKWFDTAKLRGYVIPGTNEKRIPERELQIFLDKYSMSDLLDKRLSEYVTVTFSNGFYLKWRLCDGDYNRFKIYFPALPPDLKELLEGVDYDDCNGGKFATIMRLTSLWCEKNFNCWQK